MLETDGRPVWLLDYDGVLNALAPHGDTKVWSEWKVQGKGSNPDSIPWHLWAPEAVKVVAEAHAAGVRVIWLTTWMEMTQRLHETITELPAGLEFLTDHGAGSVGPSRHWKANAAMMTVPYGVPLLWTDDDLNRRLVREKAVKEWLASRGDTTLMCPRKEHGLTPEHVTKIREWIAVHTPR